MAHNMTCRYINIEAKNGNNTTKKYIRFGTSKVSRHMPKSTQKLSPMELTTIISEMIKTNTEILDSLKPTR